MLLMTYIDAKGVRSRSIATGSKIARDKQLCYLYNQPSVEFCEKKYPKQEELQLTSAERFYVNISLIIMFLMIVFMFW